MQTLTAECCKLSENLNVLRFACTCLGRSVHVGVARRIVATLMKSGQLTLGLLHMLSSCCNTGKHSVLTSLGSSHTCGLADCLAHVRMRAPTLTQLPNDTCVGCSRSCDFWSTCRQTAANMIPIHEIISCTLHSNMTVQGYEHAHLCRRVTSKRTLRDPSNHCASIYNSWPQTIDIAADILQSAADIAQSSCDLQHHIIMASEEHNTPDDSDQIL